MKKILGTCKKYSFIVSAAALILYVLIEALDSIIGAFRGHNLFDFGVVFNIALLAAGALLLFRQVKFAAIPFGVAAVVNIAWILQYTVNLVMNLLNFGFSFDGYPLGFFNVLFSYLKTGLSLLAMVLLGALCVLVVMGKLKNLTKHWYVPGALQAVVFILSLLESIITLIKLLFGPYGKMLGKLGYVYDFGADTLMGLLLLAAVAFSGLAIHTYTLLAKKQ